MKSIKEKAKKWCSEHSNKCCTEKCDGCWLLKQAWGCEQHNMETAYEEGANYVLEELTKILPKEDRLLNDAGKSLLCRLNGCIKQLDACTDWLKPLRPQPKQEWNEEDEKIALSIEQVMNCASLLNIVPDKIERIRTWLKTLKQRII